MNADRTAQELIVNVPHQLSHWRRWTEAGLAGLAAAAWLMVLRPVLLLAAWAFGFGMAHRQLMGSQSAGRLAQLGMLCAVAVGLSLTVFAWNRLRALQRRGRVGPRGAPDQEAMAACFELTPAQLDRLQQTRSLVVERTAPRQVHLACDDGTSFPGHHDPLGLPPMRPRLTLSARQAEEPSELRKLA